MVVCLIKVHFVLKQDYGPSYMQTYFYLSTWKITIVRVKLYRVSRKKLELVYKLIKYSFQL